MQTKQSTEKILDALDEHFGYIDHFLDHKNVFEFLLAVILSAQTTDVMVNKVTPDLFAKYPTPKDLKVAKVQDVETLIRRVNYHRTKAKHIIETARIIDEVFNGEVPGTLAELITLPGVGRKVANVILSDFHNIPEGFVVDTHVRRVSYRVGWTKNTTPEKIEIDMMKALPQDRWIQASKQLILIGRTVCFPKKPNCKECPLNELCEKNGVVH